MENPVSMTHIAACLLGAGALGGVIMAGLRFSGAPRPPSWLAMLHGMLAAAGLTLLMYAALTIGLSQMALAALGLLIVAALGGAFMNLRFHAKMLPLPIPMMVAHAVLAIIGLGLLVLSVCRVPVVAY